MSKTAPIILILEDNPDDIALIQHRLKDHFEAPETIVVMDQTAYQQVYSRKDIDAIIVDNHLGWISGIELIPQLRQAWPDAPVVMFTITGSEEMAVEIMKAGVDDYLVKSPAQYRRLPLVIEGLIEQYQMRSALQHSELLNQSMVQNVQEGIVVYDTELRYRMWNRFMERITGTSAADVIGKISYEVFPYLIESGIHDILKRVLEGETIRSSDIPYYVQSSGKTGWTQGTYSPLVDQHGRIFGVLSTLYDITERKQSESERENLLSAERQRAVQLAHLNSAAKEIAAATDKPTLYRSIARHLRQIASAMACNIFVPVNHGDKLVLEMFTNADQNSESTVVLPTKEHLDVLKSGKTQTSLGTGGLGGERNVWLLRMAMQAQQRTLAIVELTVIASNNPFPEDVRILAETLLEHAGIALAEIESIEEERLLRRQAETLRDVAQILNSPNQLETVLNAILSELKQVVAFDSASIMLLHDDIIRIEAAQGAAQAEEYVNYEFVLVENKVIHPCIYNHQRVYIPDVLSNPDWLTEEGLGDIRSWIGAPLIIRGESIGVLTVDGFSPNQFNENDLQFVEAFASHSATAIQNARLLTETTEALQREQQLNDIVLTISQNLDTPTLLETIARQATELINGDIASIVLLDTDTRQVVDLFYHNKPDTVNFTVAEKNEESGMVWDLLNSGITQVERNYSAHPQALQEWIDVGVHAFVAVPLWARESIIGGLAIFSTDESLEFDARTVAIVESIGRQAGIALENARLYEQMEEAFLETVLALANAMDARDSYTGEHSHRMAELAWAVGKRMELPPHDLESLRLAALLHDIGKIGVPDDILLKPSSLTRHEYQVIKSHPELGASIVAPIKKLREVAPIILSHQEWFNGNGYPKGLTGSQIPLGARILAVVDSYTAITDQRVYRKARSHETAIAELQAGKHSQFDPDVVDIFLELVQDEQDVVSVKPAD